MSQQQRRYHVDVSQLLQHQTDVSSSRLPTLAAHSAILFLPQVYCAVSKIVYIGRIEETTDLCE